jgi:hypothetical protein
MIHTRSGWRHQDFEPSTATSGLLEPSRHDSGREPSRTAGRLFLVVAAVSPWITRRLFQVV